MPGSFYHVAAYSNWKNTSQTRIRTLKTGSAF
jgi:hypothetical protein